jgi:alanyl aminopeptidase
MRSSVLAITAALAACSSHPPPHGTGPTPPPDAAGETALPDRAPPEPAPPTLRLPTSFAPTAYTARLKIDPAQPRFDGDLTIDAKLAAPSAVIWLHAQELTIDAADATIGGAKPVTLTATPRGDHFVALRAAQPMAAGEVHVHLAYHGTLSDTDHVGAWRQQWDKDWYVSTQFESIFARRVFPCVDEPSSKVPWQLTLEVPEGNIALSNTTATAKPARAGWQTFEFPATRPLPSYLVAFAVGPYELVDGGKTPSGKPIRIAVPKGRGAEGAYAAKTTREVVGALEEYFGEDYPYDKLDEVAVANGGGGAMENAGMITYGEKLILIDPKDPALGLHHAWLDVSGHEIAHHWFGDLVTTSWWDDIWLNEAFATWMETKVLEKLDPASRPDLAAVQTLVGALGSDDLSKARAIRQPIGREDDILNAFDGVTYGKGASVIRMFERFVGPDRFKDAVREYLRAHEDRTATAEDFLDRIIAPLDLDVRTAFETFLDQPGAPRITATLTCEKGHDATVALTQDRYLPKGAAAAGIPLWHVPVCVAYPLDSDGGRVVSVCQLLEAANGTMKLNARCPAWIYANGTATGYYRVGMTPEHLRVLLDKGWPKLDDGQRLALAADVGAMVRHGDVDAGVLLDLIPKLLKEKPAAFVDSAVRLTRSTQDFVPDAQRAAYEAWLRKTYGPIAKKLGWQLRKGDDAETDRIRATVVPLVADDGAEPALRAEAVKLAAKWQSLPTSIRASLLRTAAQDGATFDGLIAQVPAVTDKRLLRELLAALGATRDPDRRARALALVVDKSVPWDVATVPLGSVSNDPASESAGASFARAHLDEIAARLPPEWAGGLAFAVSFDCDPATRDAAAKAAESLRKLAGAPRSVDQAIERMDECIAQKALQAPGLATYFGKHK